MGETNRNPEQTMDEILASLRSIRAQTNEQTEAAPAPVQSTPAGGEVPDLVQEVAAGQTQEVPQEEPALAGQTSVDLGALSANGAAPVAAQETVTETTQAEPVEAVQQTNAAVEGPSIPQGVTLPVRSASPADEPVAEGPASTQVQPEAVQQAAAQEAAQETAQEPAAAPKPAVSDEAVQTEQAPETMDYTSPIEEPVSQEASAPQEEAPSQLSQTQMIAEANETLQAQGNWENGSPSEQAAPQAAVPAQESGKIVPLQVVAEKIQEAPAAEDVATTSESAQQGAESAQPEAVSAQPEIEPVAAQELAAPQDLDTQTRAAVQGEAPQAETAPTAAAPAVAEAAPQVSQAEAAQTEAQAAPEGTTQAPQAESPQVPVTEAAPEQTNAEAQIEAGSSQETIENQQEPTGGAVAAATAGAAVAVAAAATSQQAEAPVEAEALAVPVEQVVEDSAPTEQVASAEQTGQTAASEATAEDQTTTDTQVTGNAESQSDEKIESMVLKLLGPALDGWLDRNMPKVLEKALGQSEAAENSEPQEQDQAEAKSA